MKKIVIVPRHFVDSLIEGPLVSNKWALISIFSNPEEKRVSKKEEDILKEAGCLEVLSLCFKDITPAEVSAISTDKGALFTQIQASQILDFINRLRDEAHVLFIHCDAGISRSGAVGLWVCRYLGLDEGEFRSSNHKVMPNQHVYETLHNISGMRDAYSQMLSSLPWDGVMKNNSCFECETSKVCALFRSMKSSVYSKEADEVLSNEAKLEILEGLARNCSLNRA